MTDIYKVNSNLPDKTKIEQINEMVLELEGIAESGKFDINEIQQFVNDIGIDRKFVRNQAIGNTVVDYIDWTHVVAETGYSIWKILPTTYAYNSNNKLYFDDKIISNKGQANAESSVYDYVYLYNGDSGSGYTDDTTEAGTEGGTEFDLMDTANDYLYIGLSSTFSGAKFEFQTRGSNYTLVVEYYNASSGDGWQTMTSDDDSLIDSTSNFESDGKITWTIPGDWATTSVNGQTKYWVRISTTSTPVTTAKAYYLVPGDSVKGLLALSSSEIQNEDWAFCSFGGYIYVTIRNTGNSAFEGDYYVTSSSSDTNLRNFFIYNHEYKGDYEDSSYTYVAAGWGFWQPPVEDKDLTTPPGSPSNGDRYLVIAGDSGTLWAGLTDTIVEWDDTNSIWTEISPSRGMVVIVKDENDLYEYTGAAWLKPYGEGGGDMTKSTYDTDDDGIVDKAETVDDGAGNSATAAEVKSAVDNDHTHSNKATLDTYTQTEIDLADAVTKKHDRSHAIDSASDHTSSITENNLMDADANGLPDDSGLSVTDVSDAVSKKHDAVTVAGAPLTLSTQEVTFNYDTNDFQLSGNNLQIKESGIDANSISFSYSGFTATDIHAAIVEASTMGGSGSDTSAIHDNVNAEISAIADKATPIGADLLLIEDSAASYAKKKITITNLDAMLTHTDANAIHDNVSAEISVVSEKTTPVAADLILIEDSADSNNKKRLQVGNIDINNLSISGNLDVDQNQILQLVIENRTSDPGTPTTGEMWFRTDV